MKSSDLKNIISGDYIQFSKNFNISFLSTDSRKSVLNDAVLFFAINGQIHDGHSYIADLYHNNVRQFIVESENLQINRFPEANFFLVKNTINALQELVIHRRLKYGFPVIGITGSNGKTIIKEWLSQMLSWKYNVVKTPKSYNSQIGVPLSVWQMQAYHNMGVFEAGISKPGEMEKLEAVIKPTIGILTNIGPAHDEGFSSRKQKVLEKLKLFRHVETLIFCSDDDIIQSTVNNELQRINLISWGFKGNPTFLVKKHELENINSLISVKGINQSYEFQLTFTDKASLENIIHCIITLIYLKRSQEEIQEALSELHTLSMRLEMKKGVNDCYLIDDSYTNDLTGLEIAINHLSNQHQRNKKTLIISDILQSGLSNETLYSRTASIINRYTFHRIIGIGENIIHCQPFLNQPFTHYNSVEDFFNQVQLDSFHNETILIKGARKFGLERIVARLQEKVHGTVLEINLDALSHNLNVYRSFLKPDTRIMVMVKAFAYGSGSIEVANLLEFHRIDYLGVAFTDEAISLRKNGISLPIMIMNPSIDSLDQIIEFRLEPEVYNLRILREFDQLSRSRNQKINIHLKLDTGMHRLGFGKNDIAELLSVLKENNNLHIVSIFSHLAGADDATHDKFTKKQAADYLALTEHIESELHIHPIKHLANSAAIYRFPQFQFDMVRLGIGLYGFDNTGLLNHSLLSVGTLKTHISQIISIKAGESVGYGRAGNALSDMKIATIAIGYADGFNRAFSNGKASVTVNGKKAPVVGRVCMDMTMIDISDIQAREGDEVIIFGNENSISLLAKSIDTIPYEILTNISQRVKRIYFSE